MTLVEVMFALVIQATVMLGIIGGFIQSRRLTESNVLHAAASSMLYGIIEQIKELDYNSLLPNYETDPSAPTGTGAPVPPYLRIRINQSMVKWVTVVHTTAGNTPAAPTSCPGPTVAAADVSAVNNQIGNIPLSTVTGTTAQQINLSLWIWIDEITNDGTWADEATAPTPDTSEVKKITIVYTYQYQDGSATRTVRDWEIILRTRYDQ